MHVLIGKRQIVLSGLIVILGLAVFVNWYFTGTDTKLSPEGQAAAENNAPDGTGQLELVNANESDYFASVRLERAAARDETLEKLNGIMAQSDENSEASVSVSAMISEISSASQRESDIETMVGASLGGECVAVISDDTVEVVVGRDGLNEDSVLKISDIVNTVCGNDYENIRICAAMG